MQAKTQEPEAETDAPQSEGLSGIAKHSIIYAAAPFLRQVISMGMTWFYTSWLGRSGFGIKENVDLWMVGIQQLLGQNLLHSMMRFYFDHEEQRKRDSVVTSTTIVVSLLAFLVCGTALLFTDWLTPLTLGEGEPDGLNGSQLERVLQLTLVLVPLQLSSLAGFYYLLIQKRSQTYTTVQTGKFLLEVLLNFWFIGHQGLGVPGFLYSMIIGEAVTTVFLTGRILLQLGLRFDWSVLKPMLIYTAPLIPVGVLQFGLHQSDRRLILEFGDQAMAGVYGLGYKVGLLTTAMLLDGFMRIWQPWIFAVDDAKERGRLVAKVSTWAVLAISAVTFGVVLYGRQGTQYLSDGPEFEPAWQVVGLVASGYVFWALYQVSQIPLYIEKRTGRILLINALALAANLGLNVWLIPRFGIIGAAIATAGSFGLLAILGMRASRGMLSVPFEYGRIVALIGLVAVACLVAWACDSREFAGQWGLITSLAVKTASCLGLLAITWFRVVRSDERGEIQRWALAKLPGRAG